MSDEPIKFATSLPLTGEFSGVGAKHADGYQFCIDEINRLGGILGRQAELIIEDNRSETEVTVAQYERFINVDNADILFGTFSSLLGYPASSIAEQNQMVLPLPSSGALRVWERGYDYIFYFQQLPAEGRHALRDRTLMLFLYNTGARVQEIAELKVGNLEFDDPPRVHLHGKGNKWRVCPLWPDTCQLLQILLAQHGSSDRADQPVFLSHQGQALTRYGIYKLVRRHTQHLTMAEGVDNHHISPHSLRHATAVHLLESGVEVNVVRAWLGHVSLETTNRYAELSLRMKAEALQRCEPPTQSSEESHSRTVWHDDADLLRWLESL